MRTPRWIRNEDDGENLVANYGVDWVTKWQNGFTDWVESIMDGIRLRVLDVMELG
jgi:hypothetical protein